MLTKIAVAVNAAAIVRVTVFAFVIAASVDTAVINSVLPELMMVSSPQ